MAAVSKSKKAKPMDKEIEIIQVEYDFANDGGAAGALDLLTASEACVIVDAYAKVKTACTSGGSATLIAGVVGGDTDACIASTAVAALTAGAVIPGASTTKGLKMASGDKIAQTIGTAAFTAGKIVYVFHVAKF